MVRPRNEKAEEAEKKMKIAITGMKDRMYRSVDQAAKELSISKTILIRRLKGGKSRSEGQETNQLLTTQEEKALATWISTSMATGNPVQHEFIREMAETLIKQCIPNNQFVLSIGPT